MDMRIIDFYYFSGTGNTKLVVRKMKEVFEKKGIKVNMFRMEKSSPQSIDTSHTIGLGFPVASQGTFKFVWEFVKNLPQTNGTSIFMVDTMMEFSGGIVGPLHKILKNKGYKLLGAKEIKMPSNLLPIKIDEEKNREKIENGLKEAEIYAEEIIEGKTKWGRVPVLSDMVGAISRSEITWRLFRKLFQFKINEDKCISCKLCVILCPVGNVFMNERNKAEFRNQCQFCLRCISFCPTEAIYMPKWKHKRYHSLKASELLKEQ